MTTAVMSPDFSFVIAIVLRRVVERAPVAVEPASTVPAILAANPAGAAVIVSVASAAPSAAIGTETPRPASLPSKVPEPFEPDPQIRSVRCPLRGDCRHPRAAMLSNKPDRHSG